MTLKGKITRLMIEIHKRDVDDILTKLVAHKSPNQIIAFIIGYLEACEEIRRFSVDK